MTPDVHGFYADLDIDLPRTAGSEVGIRCFVNPDAHKHGDRKPSCSVNLDTGAFHCHGCGAGGGAYDAAIAKGWSPREAMRALGDHGLAEGPVNPIVKPARRRAPVSEEQLAAWAARLAADERRLAQLMAIRRWTPEAIRALQIGYVERHEFPGGTEARPAVVFSTFDAEGAVAGCVYYQPNPDYRDGRKSDARGPRQLFPRPESIPGDELWVVEGEPDAVAARTLDLPAVALPGAGKADPSWPWRLAEGRKRIRLVPDCDAEGRQRMEGLAADLVALGVEDVRIVELGPGREDGHDLGAELIEAGAPGNGSTYALVQRLRARADKTSPVEKRGKTEITPGRDGVSSDISLVRGSQARSRAWPAPLSTEAAHGLVSEIVRRVLPHTEADPAAVHILVLAAFGSAIGRGPFIDRGNVKHGPNLYACLFGETSVGRKGTAWAVAQAVVAQADPEWEARCKHGLVSGEGVIHHVRDERTQRRQAKDSEKDKADEDGWITEVVDAGIADKRLCIEEAEFSRVLAAIDRRENTLSPVLRQFWDKGTASTLAKNAGEHATGVHLSLFVQITPHELRTRLSSTEIANGFCNRFLFVASRQSKFLSRGGTVPADLIAELAEPIAEALTFARRVRQVELGPDAAEMWDAEYERLTRRPPGLLGAVTGRATQYVLRLALIYALLDQRASISPDHLRAALAVWRYCEDSARYMFGDKLGDSIADRLLAALTAAEGEGATLAQQSEALGRKIPADKLADAREMLRTHRLALGHRAPSGPEGGRPTEKWWAFDWAPRELREAAQAEAVATSAPAVVAVAQDTANGHGEPATNAAGVTEREADGAQAATPEEEARAERFLTEYGEGVDA